MMTFVDEIERLSGLVEALKHCQSDFERIEALDRDERVQQWAGDPSWLRSFAATASQECELIIKSLVAIGQEKNLLPSAEQIRITLAELFPVEAFYKEMGGIVGYHWTLFSLLARGGCKTAVPQKIDDFDAGFQGQQAGPCRADGGLLEQAGEKARRELASKGRFAGTHEFCNSLRDEKSSSPSEYYQRPAGIDITSENEPIILEGIVSLPFLAEIYPVGGAADRLKLFDPVSGEPLPAAKLEFCGHSLLEGLVRDIQAREYLYYKLFNIQTATPIAMMTSSEKENHRHILSLCEEKKWFGRPKEAFRFFCQPLVPTMDKEGKWCLSAGMKLLMKPGGHGVLWKAAEQNGIYDWLRRLGRKKILVRQINNPISGTDYGLLAFCGIGFQQGKIFGFASCPRQVQSAEGVNLIICRAQEGCRLTSIEYCDFSKFSIEDTPVHPGSLYSQYPSNTNILFADIDAVEGAARRCPIPGMLVNLKNLSYIDEDGELKSLEAARLESTMQNIADCFEETCEGELKTYLTHNHRKKTISATKKLYQPGSSLLETPEGCFYDLLLNAHELLTQYCRISVPEVPDTDAYIEQGPSFLFQYHPALGPLYSIIGQKLRGGKFLKRSELKLEIAEVDISHLHLSGSLHVIADQVVGEMNGEGILKYSENVGKCRLTNVSVENQGLDPQGPNVYWKGEIKRFELCEIILHGNAEFHAENVCLRGDLKIEVESGMRLTAYGENGSLKFKKEPITEPKKGWTYSLSGKGSILLK